MIYLLHRAMKLSSTAALEVVNRRRCLPTRLPYNTNTHTLLQTHTHTHTNTSAAITPAKTHSNTDINTNMIAASVYTVLIPHNTNAHT